MSFTRWSSSFRPTLEGLEDRRVPSTLTVSSAADGGAGSLRATIGAAHSGDTLAFAPGLAGRTIMLTGGELLLTKNLTITGLGQDSLTLSRSTLLSNNASGVGGGIDNNGTATVNDSTLSGNSSTSTAAGGISSRGALTVSNSSLSNNTALGNGGAIDNYGTAAVSGSTF